MGQGHENDFVFCFCFSLPPFSCPFFLGMDDLAHGLHVYAAHGIDETNMELMLRKLFCLFPPFCRFLWLLEFSNNTYCLVLFSLRLLASNPRVSE